MLEHSGARVRLLRERRPGGQDRADSRPVPGARARRPVRGRPRATRSRWPACGGWAPTVPPDAAPPPDRGGRSPTISATLVYTSGTTGPPKGCMLTPRQPAGDGADVRRAARLRRQPLAVSVPAARARARPGRPDRRAQRRAPGSSTGAATRPRSSTSCAELAHALPGRPPALREDPRRRRRPRRRGLAGAAGAVRLGAASAAPERGRRCAGRPAARPARPASSTGSPTGSCSPRSAASFGSQAAARD